MGWAKYYEDNVSIYEDRMYLRNDKVTTTSVITNIKKNEGKKTTNMVKAENKRRISG